MKFESEFRESAENLLKLHLADDVVRLSQQPRDVDKMLGDLAGEAGVP